jgi:hypothetical protein
MITGLNKDIFFMLGCCKDNDIVPHLPMSLEELKVWIAKAFLKMYPDIPQNGWQQGLISI